MGGNSHSSEAHFPYLVIEYYALPEIELDAQLEGELDS